MSWLPPSHGMNGPSYQVIRFQDFAVNWAGPNPFGDGFCFGSEEGGLKFTDEDGGLLAEISKASDSGEAVNGVARLGSWMAVATRQEVTFGRFPPQEDGRYAVVVFPHGGHGVSAAAGGYFLAPLGRTGLLVLRPMFDPGEGPFVIGPVKEGLYFYRAITFPEGRGNDLIICAARRGGIGITEFRWGQKRSNLSMVSYPGLDVVDVCSIGTGSGLPAAVAVGRDGTLVFLRDVLRDKKPATLKFQVVEGTAYRLLNSGGDLFLLTSQGLYGLMDIAGRFLRGEIMGSFPTPVLVVPLQAVDANLVRDRWLLLVMPDQVRKTDIENIRANIPDSLRHGDMREWLPSPLTPDWEEQGMEQLTEQALMAS